MSTARVSPSRLEELTTESFVAMGVPDGDATSVAAVLVYADLRGLDAHGVYRLPAYLERVARGLAGGTTPELQTAGHGAVRHVDAGQALGPAAAVRATDLAIELAGEHGIGLVSVRRSTHVGAVGYYATKMAERGLVGLVMSNGPSVVAPHGAVDPFLGTNPLAIGIPLGRHGVFVHDMATGASRAKIRIAADAGNPIEPGLAIDAAGLPTTDAAAALLGSVLPIAGAKGSGLALAIALLAGAAGAEFDDEIAPTYGAHDRPQNLGQIFLVLDPAPLGPPDASIERTEGFIDRLHSLRSATGAPIRFSGEAAAQRAQQRYRDGIPFAHHELLRLARACEGHGLARQGRGFRDLAAGT